MAFASVWLPARWLERVPSRAVLGGTLVVSVALGALMLVFADQLPLMFSASGYTLPAKLLNVLGGAGFLVGAAFFLFGRNGVRHHESLVYASHCLLFAT